MKSLAAFLLCLMAGHAMAEEGPRSMARAHLEPAGLVVVGQPVKLVVDVLVTTWFTSASEFSVFDLPGASGNFANIGSRRSHLTPRPIPTTGRRLRRRRYEASEAATFSELEGAVAHSDDVETVRWLYEWLDRSGYGGRPAQAEQAAIIAQDDHYKEETEALLARRFGSAQGSRADWTSKAFGTSLHRVRKQVTGGGKATADPVPILAPLNPE